MRMLIALACLLSIAAINASATPTGQAAPGIVGIGGECDALVHTQCAHVTALGTCHLYVGGAGGACIVYGEGPVGRGGDCEATVHVDCEHWSALGRCGVYLGTSDRCIIY